MRTPDEHGAAAIEFALLLPLLVMLAFGISEFGTAYNRSQGMQAAVREGARFASTGDVPSATVAVRVRNTLQGNGGGSGFPDPGGSGDVVNDIVVRVHALTDAEFATWTDGNPANDASGTDVSAGTACAANVHGVRVEAEVNAAYAGAYGLELPLIPGSPFDLSHHAQAIFRCI